jgi:hypothetical protein
MKAARRVEENWGSRGTFGDGCVVLRYMAQYCVASFNLLLEVLLHFPPYQRCHSQFLHGWIDCIRFVRARDVLAVSKYRLVTDELCRTCHLVSVECDRGTVTVRSSVVI